ncbi:MAG: aldo/keto reductase family protein [Spirochaetia bacterium]
MKYRRLGNTGLLVSEIAYGSWLTFGNQVDRKKADGIISKALDLGINYFDTADVYSKGQAEILLGTVLPNLTIRQNYVLATKVYFPMGDGVNNRGLSRKHIFDSIHDSLRRLRLEYVDLYYCHRYDENTPLVETIQAMQDLIHQGKVLHWGVSEWTADQIAEAAAKCKANGWSPPAVDQPKYSILDRSIEEHVIPTCSHHGLGVAVFSPLSQGILTGKYSGGKIPEGSRAGNQKINVFMRERLQDKDLLVRVDKLQKTAEEMDLTLPQLALAYCLRKKEITSLIIGASSEKQLEENVKASGVKLPQEVIDKIETLFPK